MALDWAVGATVESRDEFFASFSSLSLSASDDGPPAVAAAKSLPPAPPAAAPFTAAPPPPPPPAFAGTVAAPATLGSGSGTANLAGLLESPPSVDELLAQWKADVEASTGQDLSSADAVQEEKEGARRGGLGAAVHDGLGDELEEEPFETLLGVGDTAGRLVDLADPNHPILISDNFVEDEQDMEEFVPPTITQHDWTLDSEDESEAAADQRPTAPAPLLSVPTNVTSQSSGSSPLPSPMQGATSLPKHRQRVSRQGGTSANDLLSDLSAATTPDAPANDLLSDLSAEVQPLPRSPTNERRLHLLDEPQEIVLEAEVEDEPPDTFLAALNDDTTPHSPPSSLRSEADLLFGPQGGVPLPAPPGSRQRPLFAATRETARANAQHDTNLPPTDAETQGGAAEERSSGEQEEGEVTSTPLEPFELDPDFDYDNCPLTARPDLHQMALEWEHTGRLPPCL